MADQKCDCAVSSAARTLSPDQCGGETELTLAVRTGRTDLVRKLLEGGASPLDTNGRDESPLLLGNYFHSPPDGVLGKLRPIKLFHPFHPT